MRVFILITLLICSSADKHIHNIFNSLQVENVKVTIDPQVEIVAGPSLDQKGSVFVSWTGVMNPKRTDWVGVYSPPQADITKISPVKFKFVVADSFWDKGMGVLEFNLINLRGDYAFVYFRGTKKPVAIAFSNIVTVANQTTPSQFHISLLPHGVQASIRIGWTSVCDRNINAVLHLSLTAEMQNTVQYRNVAINSYARDDLCGPPATTVGWHDPGCFYFVDIENLQANTRYYYQVQNEKTGGGIESKSQIFSFVSSLPVGTREDLKFIVYGDLGHGETDGSMEIKEEMPSLATTRKLLELENDARFFLHIGDISYADGYSSQWDEFMNQIEPIASSIPYMVVQGNHERGFPNSNGLFETPESGGECGIPNLSRFPTPKSVSWKDSLRKPWMSFDYGPVHVIMMSTEDSFVNGSPQYSFIEKDLESVDRKVTPFIIFTGHRPMYLGGTFFWDEYVSRLLKSNLEPLLIKHSVDLVFWAHHHSYQRTCPLVDFECNTKGPIHIIAGMAGKDLTRDFSSNIPWLVYSNHNTFGYVRVLVKEKSSKLQVEFVRSVDGTILDSVEIYKKT